jgi:hypothetical protein
LIYLDASVVVAALTQEARSDEMVAWLEARDNRSLAVSHWTRVEVASALSVKARRKELSSDQHKQALDYLGHLADGILNWRLVEPVQEDFWVAEHLAGQYPLNLRGSDALHIAIAYRHEWELATLDKDMRAAAERAGVIVNSEFCL